MAFLQLAFSSLHAEAAGVLARPVPTAAPAPIRPAAPLAILAAAGGVPSLPQVQTPRLAVPILAASALPSSLGESAPSGIVAFADDGTDAEDAAPGAAALFDGSAPQPPSPDGSNLLRPGIMSVPPRRASSGDVPVNWPYWREGLAGFLAELAALYPTEDVYFLERDARLIYDLAEVLLRDEPGTLRRFHTIHVTRFNANRRELKAYLVQEGLNSANLKRRRAVIVDTGYRGSIPRAIRGLYSGEDRKRIVAHMAMSWSPGEIPNSDVFKEFFGSRNANEDAAIRHPIGSSTHFRRIRNKLIPYTSETTDPQRRKESLLQLADLRHFAERPLTAKIFHDALSSYRTLIAYIRNEIDLTDGELRSALGRLSERQQIAFVRDLSTAIQSRNLEIPPAGLARLLIRMPAGAAILNSKFGLPKPLIKKIQKKRDSATIVQLVLLSRSGSDEELRKHLSSAKIGPRVLLGLLELEDQDADKVVYDALALKGKRRPPKR